MKGYCYCVALWLLLLADQLVSAHRVKGEKPLGRLVISPGTMAVMDVGGSKADQYVRIGTANRPSPLAQNLPHGIGSSKGSKSSHGTSQVHDNYSHKKGLEGREKQVVIHGENGGKKQSSEHGANHQAQHHEAQKAQEGHKYNEGDHQKKTGFTKGFHGKYHKDEYHKLDKHWKNAKENGGYEKYGEEGEHFYKKGSKHTKALKSSKGSQASQHGKKGKHGKGHQSSENKGHQGQKGYQKQSAHGSEFAKKGGKSAGKQHTYKVFE